MALLPWGDEEKKDENLFQMPTVKPVQSVQSSWQPAEPGSQSGEGNPSAQGQTPYLLSQEKAEVDQQKRLKQAAEEARQAEIARQSQIAREQQAKEDAATQAQYNAGAKYTPAKPKKDEGFWGFVKDVGAGIQQGLGAVGDIAIQGGGVIGSIGKNDQELVKHLANVEKVRGWLHGQKDINGNELTGTRDVEQQATRIATGQGDLQDYLAVGGKSLQAGIDATMFVNPARLATKGLPVVADAGNFATRVFKSPAVRYAARDAAFFGGLQGSATFQSVYGQTGDFEQAIEAALKDAAIGAGLQGTLDLGGSAINVAANRTLNSLRKPREFTPLKDALESADNIVDAPQNTPSGVTVDENGVPTDGNVTFQPVDNTPPTQEVTPVGTTPQEPTVTPVADGIVTPVNDAPTEPVVSPVVQDTPVVPETPVTDTIPTQETTPAPVVNSVADGVPVPNKVVPETNSNTPVIKSEEARALREAKAGATQAEEAAINQRLQELRNETPNYFREDSEIPDINRILKNEDTVAGGQKVADYYREAKGEDWRVQEMTPDEYLERAARAMGQDPSSWRGAHSGDVEAYAEAMRNGDKFPMPFINEVLGSQEGRTRALAAKKAGQERMRVAVAEKYNPERYAERIKNEEEMAHTQRLIDMLDGKVKPEQTTDQWLQEADNATPRDGNVPDEMNTDITGVEADGTPLIREQVAQRLMPKLDDQKDVKQKIATAVGMEKDVESPIRDILREGGVKEKQVERVATQFEKLESQLREYNRLEEMNQKAYTEGGASALSDDVSRERSRIARDMGTTQRRLMDEINRIEGSRDKKVALINNLTDIIGTRNANVLTSAGLLERNIFQEITANLKLAAKNPIKMAKSTFGNGNIFKDTAKSELSHWKDTPGYNPVKIVKYVVGNTYRTAMIPTTALANTRRGAVREELTRWAYKELEGREISSSEAKKLAGAAGNEMEALVNTFIGVDNGMTNRKQATDALQAWKEYIRSGDDGAKSKFLEKVEAHSSLADQMISGLSKSDQTKFRALKAMGNLIFPFVRTATNLAKNTVRQDLNPMAKSLLDEIRADQRSGGNNAINLIKSKLVDYGIMGGAAALATSGLLVYNDGDEVDKPQGWSLKLNDNQYVPVRATALELPIALAGTAQAIASDVASGDARDWQYYAGMVTKSLPYIDQINTTTGAVDSLMNVGNEDGDAGYAIKSYGVNMAKSFVPFSNNGVQPYVEGKMGKSLNAKSSYDEDLMTWLGNTVRKSYDPDFYNSLKDSRDNAGRVRTVDNQGVVSNKQINDENTKIYNDDITELVDYGRKNGLGKSTEDMFNSYDTGKNNNFKSIQDAITFLDVETGADGKKSPKNEDKLKSNPKLANLSQQIRDGFFGETGDDLLTLDGENLYSDVSAPNSAGSKNSRMPISMQSIKNAIAQTDLPEAERNRIYEISQADTALYNRLKNKEITYEQYTAEKAKSGQEYIDILSNSESYKKMLGLFEELDNTGFFDADGMGSTRSGQTYLWNSLNALLGSKGATPAANYPDDSKGFTPWGNGDSTPASYKPGDRGDNSVKFTPVTQRQMAQTKAAKFTPFSVKVKLGNEVKKNKTQNYADKTF